MKTSRGGAGMKLVAALAVFTACLAMAWMVFLPRAVAGIVRARTGFDVDVQTLYCNPFAADLVVRGLVIRNPATFPRKDFLDLRECRVEARLASLFGRRWVVDDATVDIAGVSVVRDQQGRVNARLFQNGWTGPSGSQPPNEAGAKREHAFLIRHLAVRIDRLVIADYSQRKPETREYNLHFSHVYENVTSGKQLAAPLVDAFGNLAAALGGVLPEPGGVLHAAGRTLQDAGRKTSEALKGFFDSLEKSFKK